MAFIWFFLPDFLKGDIAHGIQMMQCREFKKQLARRGTGLNMGLLSNQSY